MSSVQLIVLFDLLLLGMGGLMAAQDRMVPAIAIFGAFGVVAVWQIFLAAVAGSFNRIYRWELFLRPTHYVQAVLHFSIYAYLGLYWEGIGRYAPLILTQIIFGYLLDMLLSWSRGRVWRIGLGVLPIVFSTNLFLWFREPVYYLQLGLMALTFFGKEFVTWEYGGRRRHIVNPSAFSLSVVSLILLATGTEDWSHAVDIAAAFDTPPNYFEVIFLLGLVVQALFVVTPVTFGAAAVQFLIFLLSKSTLGYPLTPTPISSAVLLGMTFLVTDPATSPRSHFGRFVFGVVYGVGVVIFTVILQLVQEPSVFAKLLFVPAINLLVPAIDRFCDRLSQRWPSVFQPAPLAPTRFARYGWLGAYIALFVIMSPALKTPYDRKIPLFPEPAGRVSPDVGRILDAMIYCRHAYPEAFRPFGFRAEIADYSEMREIYRTGPPSMPPPPPGDRPPESSTVIPDAQTP